MFKGKIIKFILFLIFLTYPETGENGAVKKTGFVFYAVPGLGQAMHGKYLKGAGILALDAALGLTAWNQHTVLGDLEKKSDEAAESFREAAASLEEYGRSYSYTDSLFVYAGDTLTSRKTSALPDTVFTGTITDPDSIHSKYNSAKYSKILTKGELLEKKSDRDITLFWMAGVSVFNTMDAVQAIKKSGDKKEWRPSPRTAVMLSLLMPPLGQLYNRQYSKAGLILMAEIGLIHAALSRNSVADYYESKEKFYKENVASSINENRRAAYYEELEDKRIKYGSKRNSHIWYISGLYIYSLFDAFVDAHLYSFDEELKIRTAVLPYEKGIHITTEKRF
ncbi:MAG: DUF5683 domain-containing protein [Fibrobacterota bacterium]